MKFYGRTFYLKIVLILDNQFYQSFIKTLTQMFYNIYRPGN